MGKVLDSYIKALQVELRVGGVATLDDIYDLAVAIQEDLLTPDKSNKEDL